VLQSLPLPDAHTNANINHLAASPDGGVWATWFPWLRFDRTGVIGTASIPSFPVSTLDYFRIDAQGDIWILGSNSPEMGASQLFRHSTADGSILQEIDFLAPIRGFALGSTGEEMFAVIVLIPALEWRLARVNLVTGTWSSISINTWTKCGIGGNDPTGFVYANVVDQLGDNDGDGHANRTEVIAGSSPYDATSTPTGPKVYLSFTPVTNAIVIEWQDRDGLFDPAGGLDLTSLSLNASGYGEVLSSLWPFVTAVSLTPDETSATVTFGGLPLPDGLKIVLKASASDKTGSVGWDWQVTPPGTL
jgi:hypothetical protein